MNDLLEDLASKPAAARNWWSWLNYRRRRDVPVIKIRDAKIADDGLRPLPPGSTRGESGKSP
jgi:hypothetical protein